MSIEDVTNPGVVNVADEGYDGLPEEVPPFGQVPASASAINDRGEVSVEKLLSVDQPVTVSEPATSALDNERGEVSVQKLISVDQPVTVQVPGEPLLSVAGGTYSPTSPNVKNTTLNNVAGQVYGTGNPTNVYP